MEINQLFNQYYKHREEIRDIEKKIKDHYVPILSELKKEKKLLEILEIAENLPPMHFKAMVYKTAYELENELNDKDS